MPMPTPLHPMHYQPSGKDVSLFIKRDDMTGVGPGGNKIRSLEFLLGEARSKSKILRRGPEQSNLCASDRGGLCQGRAGTVSLSSTRRSQPAKREISAGGAAGTKIHSRLLVSDGAVRNRRMGGSWPPLTSPPANRSTWSVTARPTGRGARWPYRRGGGNEAAVRESWDWPHDDFCPGGNGGVAAGLIYGNQLMGQPFRIVIVSVEDDRETLTAHIRSTISGKRRRSPGSP